MEGCNIYRSGVSWEFLSNYEYKVLDPPLMVGWDQRIRDGNSKVR